MVMTDFNEGPTEAVTLADVVAKKGVKVLDDAITLADATLYPTTTKVLSETITIDEASIESPGESDYETPRQSNATDAMDLLVAEINKIQDDKTLNYIDILSGYGGAQYVGVLMFDKNA